MPAAFDEGPFTFFDVPAARIDAARTGLAEGRSLATALGPAVGDATLAPLIPIGTRLAQFQHDLETLVRSAAGAGVAQQTVDALLAVALTLSERFPESS